MQDSVELLRACATDAEAVQLYLRSMDPEELDGLLDEFSRYENQKKKSSSASSDTPNWPPLVRLLLRSPTSRLRTATRIIQLLWHGGASELASMQWLTEISLGYVGALEDKHYGGSDDKSSRSTPKAQQQQKRRNTLVHELKVMLEIVFEFLRNVIAEQRHGKVLPQLLSLVPLFLGILTELQTAGGSSDNAVYENLVTLLELPWDVKTIPFLLDLLKESGDLVSPSGWKQLRENVARMVASNQSAMTANMNTILRECIFIANVTNDVDWILISRFIFSHMPMNLRQEAEFTLHMCFHQSQRIVALICESIRKSLEDDDQIRRCEGESPIVEDAMNTRVGWHDLVLLFHALQASKPVLHHRATSSRVATDASVFVEIQQMVWAIFQLDFQDRLESDAHPKSDSLVNWPKYVTEKASQIIAFGGKQVHAREWKALLMMDFAFFWIENDERSRKQKTKKSPRRNSSDIDNQLGLPATRDLTRFILLAVYQTTPEVRSELLSSLFDGSKNTQYTAIYSEAIEQLFRAHSGSLHSHLNAIQDWLSSLFHNHFDIAQEFFLMASRLATMYKDLYSFLMIFLRKLLSMANRRYQQFAIDIWCSWLEHGLTFDVQQEEEIISAIKNSILVCPGILSWSLDRLTRVFIDRGKDQQALALRRSSWEDFHQFISQQLGQFIQFNMHTDSSRNANTSHDSIDDASDFEEEDHDSSYECQRFCFHSLDTFYRQNSSFTGAAEIGVIFQKTFLCLVRFEQAAGRSFSSGDTQAPSFNAMGNAMSRWVIDLVSNLDFFFNWVCQQPDGSTFRESAISSLSKSDSAAMWHMLARVTLGCGLSSLALELTLHKLNPKSDEEARRRKKHDENATPSLWSMMEIQFCLHRVLRKLANGAAMDATTSKACFAGSIRGLSSVLEPNVIQLLTIMSGTLTGQDQQTKSKLGVSFDALLFVLDVSRSHVSIVASGRHQNHSKRELFEMFEVLLQLYRNVVHRALQAAESDDDDAENDNQSAMIFTLYSDAITAKFPKPLRHLASAAKNTKSVILLDAKAADHALSRVCTALMVSVDAMVVLNGIHETEAQLRRHLESSEPHVGRDGLVARQARSNGFLDLAHEILFDVKQSMNINELAKFKISGTNLTKQLSEHGARITSASCTTASDGLPILSSLAYGVMCEHTVYQPPFLRGLLSICFSNYLSSDLERFAWLSEKIEASIQASGFQLVSIKRIRTASEQEDDRKRRRNARQKTIRSEPSPLIRRKRLRQVIEISSDEEDEETASSTNRTHQTPAVAQPYLNLPAAQIAAILSVLSAAECAQSTCFKVLSADSIKRIQDPVAVLEKYGRTMRVLLQTLLSDQDLSWVTPKLQTKMLSVIEWNIRIGKACDAARKTAAPASSIWSEVTVNLLECAVHVGLHSRSWTQLLRGGNQDTGARARISAVSMKIDIFLLDAPQVILSMMKDKTLTESLFTRLKALLASVQEQFASSAPHKGFKKTKAHLVGVVPIVKKRRKRLRSRHPYIDNCLGDEDGDDAYADLEDFIEA